MDHRRAEPQQRRGNRPPGESRAGCHQAQSQPLESRAAGDEPLAPPPVDQGSGEELTQAPHRRVEGRQHAERATESPAEASKDREEAPRQAVVEVVDQTRLTGSRQGGLSERRLREHLPVREVAAQVVVTAVDTRDVSRALEPRMLACLTDEQHRHAEAEGGIRHPEQERRRAQSVGLRE